MKFNRKYFQILNKIIINLLLFCAFSPYSFGIEMKKLVIKNYFIDYKYGEPFYFDDFKNVLIFPQIKFKKKEKSCILEIFEFDLSKNDISLKNTFKMEHVREDCYIRLGFLDSQSLLYETIDEDFNLVNFQTGKLTKKYLKKTQLLTDKEEITKRDWIIDNKIIYYFVENKKNKNFLLKSYDLIKNRIILNILIPPEFSKYTLDDHYLNIFKEDVYLITYSEIIKYHKNKWSLVFEDKENKENRWYPFGGIFANNYIGISPDDDTNRFFYYNFISGNIIKDTVLLNEYADTNKYEYINSFIFDPYSVSILFILKNIKDSKYYYIVIKDSKNLF